MRASHWGAALTSVVAVVGVLSAAPAARPALHSDPAAVTEPLGKRASRASAPCEQEAGRLAVTALATAPDGSHPIIVTGSRMEDGSTWRVRAAWEEAGQLQRFRRTADAGGWSIRTRMPASEDDAPDFFVMASHPELGDVCVTGLVPGPPALGYAGCGDGLDGVAALRREDGALRVVGFMLAGAPDRSRWHVRVRQRDDQTRQVVAYDDYSNRFAELVSGSAFLGGPAEPRLWVKVTSRENGLTCRIRLNPGDLTRPVEERPTPLRVMRSHGR